MNTRRLLQIRPRGSAYAKTPAQPVASALPQLTQSAALAAFHTLIAAWAIPPARAWRMLTGVGYQAGSLTEVQAERVAHLVAIDEGIRKIRGNAVGEWLVAGNGSAVTSGSSPIDFLTRAGTGGYAALLQQVQRWLVM